MDTLTERLERLAELQKKNIEPLQQIGGSAFAAFERMARKNYELMGDMVEYAVAQSRGSIEQSSPQAIYEHQMSEARAFAERMSERAAEYLALAEQLRGEMAPNAFGEQAGEANDSSSTSPAEARSTERPASHADRETSTNERSASAGKASATSKSAAEKASSKKTGSKKASSKKTASKKAGSKKTASKKASSKKVGSKNTGSKKTSSKKTGLK